MGIYDPLVFGPSRKVAMSCHCTQIPLHSQRQTHSDPSHEKHRHRFCKCDHPHCASSHPPSFQGNFRRWEGEHQGGRDLSIVLLLPGQGNAEHCGNICSEGSCLAHVVGLLTILASLVDEFAVACSPLSPTLKLVYGPCALHVPNTHGQSPLH